MLVAMLVLRRLVIPACACLLLLSGCTKDEDKGSGTADGGKTTPKATAPATPSPGGSPVALDAATIADKLGCTEKTPGQKAAADPVGPVEAVDCKVGEVVYQIRTYRSNAEVDDVVEAAGVGTGYRNVGEKWLVAVDTEEGAKYVLEKVGGRIVDLRYTTPGS
jgi:hypothetical protein